jgi:hypothetical protein
MGGLCAESKALGTLFPTTCSKSRLEISKVSNKKISNIKTQIPNKSQ